MPPDNQKDEVMWDKFKDWLASPYQEDMDAFNWFLFFGLIIVIMAAWRIILKHILED